MGIDHRAICVFGLKIYKYRVIEAMRDEEEVTLDCKCGKSEELYCGFDGLRLKCKCVENDIENMSFCPSCGVDNRAVCDDSESCPDDKTYCTKCGEINQTGVKYHINEQFRPHLSDRAINMLEKDVDVDVDEDEIFDYMGNKILGYDFETFYSYCDGDDGSIYVHLDKTMSMSDLLKVHEKQQEMKKVFDEVGLWADCNFDLYSHLESM